MRTNDERLAAMHRRAGELTREKRKRQTIFVGAASCALGLALVIVLGLWMPSAAPALSHETASAGMSASMFSSAGALSYIVEGLLAFLLGICVTLFCIRLKKWREDSDKEDRP